jgi:hypothetical protein
MAGDQTVPDRQPDPARGGRSVRIAMRIIVGVAMAVGVAWQVVQTEWKVASLRERGFSDFVIESTRNHGYFPMIGALVGALVAILIAKVIKAAWSKR